MRREAPSRRLQCAFAALGVAIAMWAHNTPRFADSPADAPTLLAHRGIAQRFDSGGVDAQTCTAARMLPSDHGFIENTIPSMRASFDAGADIVEIDVHPTTDGHFAVFHDWTLECRTNGVGVTREQTMDYLKTLDVGWGYTADGGRTFPLRGTGVGAMPSLREVLDDFPGERFLVNVKSRELGEADRLAAFFDTLTPASRARLSVYGGGGGVMERLSAIHPDVPTMSRERLVGCLTRYVAFGWSGFMPETCRGTLVVVPIDIAPWLWGWPDRLLGRFAAVGTEIFVSGPRTEAGFLTGLDTRDDLARLPEGYVGGIWTDDIETIAAALGRAVHRRTRRRVREAARPARSRARERTPAVCRTRTSPCDSGSSDAQWWSEHDSAEDLRLMLSNAPVRSRIS